MTIYYPQVYHDPDNSTQLPPWDWSVWAGTNPIASIDFVIPVGLTLAGSTIAPPLATCLVSGGMVGETYLVTCRCTLTNGRSEDSSFQVICVQK